MSTKYQAVINTPGYLPQSDDVYLFDSVNEAWGWLITERDRDCDSADCACPDVSGLGACSEALSVAQSLDLPGTVYLPTSAYDGDHDLGVGYTVVPLTPEQVRQLDIDPDACVHEWITDATGVHCTLCPAER